jgi:hypothetical protein
MRAILHRRLRRARTGNAFGMTELFAGASVFSARLRGPSPDAGKYGPAHVDVIDEKHGAAHPGGAVDG